MTVVVDGRAMAAKLPHPDPTANKYSRGKCVIFAGMPRYGGAAVLACRGAQRTGAGYTVVFTVTENAGLVRGAAPSAVVGTWSAAVLTRLEATTPERPVAYVVGPGFDADDVDTRQVTCGVLKAAAPAVVDGGALSVLGTRQARAILENRRSEGISTVITPHLGEAMRLYRALGFEETPADPAQLAEALAAELGVVAVVKGPLTFIADSTETRLMDRGTAVLAKAGTGDVLAGMMGALLAQGLDAMDAAQLACLLHAEAGRIAAETYTDIAAIPEDIIASIPRAIMALDALN
ncbi:MAG: NAD(P)H-hydrate dehydratase [Eggerthellaceae bacterium]|nr:NAD(P)H-hydrate dehydratase [Eggerthellaceae bacterium]